MQNDACHVYGWNTESILISPVATVMEEGGEERERERERERRGKKEERERSQR